MAILDLVPLLSYLYDVAHAYRGKDVAPGLEDVRAVAPLGLVGQSRPSVVGPACRVCRVGKTGSAAADRERTIDGA